VSVSTAHPKYSPPLIRPVALDHTRHPCGVLPGPPVAMEFFGEVGEDEVADVLAHDGGELEELRDDAGEVEVCFGVAKGRVPPRRPAKPNPSPTGQGGSSGSGNSGSPSKGDK